VPGNTPYLKLLRANGITAPENPTIPEAARLPEFEGELKTAPNAIRRAQDQDQAK
jgi:hypothetical protein